MRAKGFVGMLVAISLLGVLLTSAPGAQAKANRPTWTVGDYWAYALAGSVGGGSSGTMKYEVLGTESMDVGAPFDAYRSRLWMNITSGSVTLSYLGDIWNRVSDLAVAKLVVSGTTNQFQFGITIVYSPPGEIQWPLTDGKQWTTTTTVTTTAEITGQQPMTTSQTTTSQYLVSPAQDTTVTAGTFSTMPVRTTQGPAYSMAYWAPAAGNTVRETTHDSNGVEQSSMTLTSYRYQGPAPSAAPGVPAFMVAIIALVVISIVAVVIATRPRKPEMPAPISPGLSSTPYPPQAPMPAAPEVPPTTPPTGPPQPPATPP